MMFCPVESAFDCRKALIGFISGLHIRDILNALLKAINYFKLFTILFQALKVRTLLIVKY